MKNTEDPIRDPHVRRLLERSRRLELMANDAIAALDLRSERLRTLIVLMDNWAAFRSERLASGSGVGPDAEP